MTFIRILLTVRAKCRDLFFGLRPSSFIISCYNSIWTCDKKKDMNYKLGGTQPMHEHEAYCSKLCYSFEIVPSTFCFTFWGGSLQSCGRVIYGTQKVANAYVFLNPGAKTLNPTP